MCGSLGAILAVIKAWMAYEGITTLGRPRALPFLFRQRGKQVRKKVGLPGDALQVRVFLALVIRNRVSLVELGIFHEQFYGCHRTLSGLECSTQNGRRPFAAM